MRGDGFDSVWYRSMIQHEILNFSFRCDDSRFYCYCHVTGGDGDDGTHYENIHLYLNETVDGNKNEIDEFSLKMKQTAIGGGTRKQIDFHIFVSFFFCVRIGVECVAAFNVFIPIQSNLYVFIAAKSIEMNGTREIPNREWSVWPIAIYVQNLDTIRNAIAWRSTHTHKNGWTLNSYRAIKLEHDINRNH